MDAQATIIEYRNCQLTKKNIILIFVTAILFIVFIASTTTLISCGISSDCSGDLTAAMIVISTFSTIPLFMLTSWGISMWCYNHNPTYKNMMDKIYLKKEISWQLDNKSKEELEQIKEHISSLPSA
jgi:hypothetical protein